MRKFLAAALVVATFVIADWFTAPAMAFEPFVSVPNGPPGGASVEGCYNANTLLFGRYRFSFCLLRHGTFSVRGASHCDGTLSWGTRRGEVDVHVRRTACRNNRTWVQADMTCWPTGRLVHNSVAALRCVYKPNVRGYRDEHFTARRN